MIEHPLHQALIADPDNDEPRLVFADWFEERGDAARAELIRLQIRLAPMSKMHPEWVSLKQREQELLKSQVRKWNADIHRFLQGTVFQGQVKARHGAIRKWFYGRGFVESIQMDAKALLENVDLVFKLGPIQHLRLYLISQSGHQLPDAEWLTGIRTLELHSDVPNDLVVSLAASPHVENLEELSIPNLGIDATTARALIESPHLYRLKKLHLERSFGRSAETTLQLLDNFGDRVRFHNDDYSQQQIAANMRAFANRPQVVDERPWWRRLLG